MFAPEITRRGFIGGSATSYGLLALGGLSLFGLSACQPPPTGTNAARNPLFLPTTVALGGGAASLRAALAEVDLGGGATSGVHAYNGTMPGPTFVAPRGDQALLDFTNGLAADTTVHWHGLVVPTVADGQPHDAVPPGGGYRYEFPVIQRSGLSFYHPHPHLMTAEQVNLGLAGGFIVRDGEEAALGLPGSWREVPLVLRDATFDAAGDLRYSAPGSGFNGAEPLVNGTRAAKLGVDDCVYRFRIVQGSNARVFTLALGDGTPFTVIGNDGGFLEAPITVTRIDLGPGERLDLLVDFRGRAVGERVVLRCERALWDLLEIEVTRHRDDSAQVPGALPTVEHLAAPVRTRTFSFDGMGKINGLAYDMHRIDFQVPFGDIERWVFATGGNAPHPVHVHGASFQVASRTGGRGAVQPWEAGWKDTVLLLDGETVEVLVRFDGYRGRYLLHCHQLEHEDRGMMQNFEVV
jgi:blue copper oxidase